MSFTNQDIADVTGQVLGTVLEIPFDLDPTVKGPLSFHVEARMTREQLLSAFSATLATQGDTLVDRKGVLTVIPSMAAPGVAPSSQHRRRDAGVQEVLPPPTYGKPAPTPASRWTALALAILATLGLCLAVVLARRSVLAIGSVKVTRREAVLARLSQAIEIPPEALDVARAAASRSGRPVEQMLNEMGVVSDEALAAAYARVTGCPIWRPAEKPVLCDPDSLGLTAGDLVGRGLVPVETRRRRLILAAVDPLDDAAIARIAHQTARTVTILVGAPGDIRRAALGPNGISGPRPRSGTAGGPLRPSPGSTHCRGR